MPGEKGGVNEGLGEGAHGRERWAGWQGEMATQETEEENLETKLRQWACLLPHKWGTISNKYVTVFWAVIAASLLGRKWDSSKTARGTGGGNRMMERLTNSFPGVILKILVLFVFFSFLFLCLMHNFPKICEKWNSGDKPEHKQVNWHKGFLWWVDKTFFCRFLKDAVSHQRCWPEQIWSCVHNSNMHSSNRFQ